MKRFVVAAILCGSISIYAEEFKEIVPFEQRIMQNSKVEKSELERKPIKLEDLENLPAKSIKEEVTTKIETKVEEVSNVVESTAKKIETTVVDKVDEVKDKLTDNNFFQDKPVITKEKFTGKLLDLAKKRSKNGKIYAEGENTPYTGKFALFLGDFIEYTETYKDGILEGPKTWYSENGNVVLEESYVNSKIEGDQKAYYENGRLKSVVNYKNGKISSLVAYSKDGKVLHKEDFKKGNGTWRYFWSNGNVLEEGRYKNWIKDGIWKKYRENGEVDSITEYKNGRLVDTTWN